MKKTTAIISSLIALLATGLAARGNQSTPRAADSIVSKAKCVDMDGNTYKIVTIGTQVWMAEDLRTTRYRNGDFVGTTTPATQNITGESVPQYQWAYDGDEKNVATYSRLYTWHAVNDSRNITPIGWHVATETEWAAMVKFLSGNDATQGRLKEAGTIHWHTPNADANNQSGFTALPSGNRWPTGRFLGLGDSAHGWTATAYDNESAWRRMLIKDAPVGHFQGTSGKNVGWLVRCVQDAPAQGCPGDAASSNDYLNQPVPEARPEVFARGVVSTDNLEHSAPAFSPDGNEVFWSLWRRPDKGEPQVIMTMRCEGGTWSVPAVASFSGKLIDGGPVFSTDGNRLYFSSADPAPPPSGGRRVYDIWFVEKQRNDWSERKSLGLLTRFPDLQSVGGPSIARNGTLYFSAHSGIYRAELVNDEYAKPKSLPRSINLPPFLNWTPFIAPDESYLLFSSNRRDPDHDAGDLYISHRQADGSWTDPVALAGPVNSGRQERFPMLSPDGNYFFFTRPTPDHDQDVYWMKTNTIPELQKGRN